MRTLISFFSFLLPIFLFAQIGVNTDMPNDAAMLDIVSSDKGVLIPRLSDADRANIPLPIPDGLIIFNTSVSTFQFHSGGSWFNLATEVSCDFISFPSVINVSVDKGNSTSFDLDFAATIGTPGNLSTSFFSSSANLDVTLDNVSNNNSPAPVTQTLDITLLASSTAVAGDTGTIIFQVTSDCGVTKFIEVTINVTGCDFSITPDATALSMTVPPSGTNSVTFTLDIDQLGTLPGTISSVTPTNPSGFTNTTTNLGCSYDCEPTITFDGDNTIIPGTYNIPVDVTSSCGVTNSITLQIMVEANPRDCKQILAENPAAVDGVYTIDPDGSGGIAPFDCECDMTTDGGGWTLVLNYLHLGGTNPNHILRTSNLPVIGSSTLGVDEAGTLNWGHATNSLLSEFNFETVRFYGITSNHSRVVHFKITQSETVSYFSTGSGSMNLANLISNHVPLTGHTANIPFTADRVESNRGDYAMTRRPFRDNNVSDWTIKQNGAGGDDWEVDDNVNNANSDTLHRIWIR
ncbi:fibrinogen-like YCDxxxxGGGW domain-containing protein [Nonlabens dokdonensis]|nr:fibrinogen-like YCDxxxxGGGW domain-containing protein [Nonlabens dokdonensis]